MSKTKTQPKLTEPQRYALGSTVQSAYLRDGWDGKLSHKVAPCIRDSTFHRGASIPQIKALLRQKVIRPATKGIHKLTQVGVEIGEQETLERTGVPLKAQAEKNRREKEEIDAKHTDEVAALVEPFKGITIRRTERFGNQRAKSITLKELLTNTFMRGSEHRIDFSQDEINEIGEEIRT